MTYKGIIISFFIALLGAITVTAQIPERPTPPRLVNDFTNTLTQQELRNLENKLVTFNDTTSNQIAIVIVPDFGGTDKADFAYKIGEEWKVGQSEFDNGVVIALRPKTNQQHGEVFIATGYGLEPVIPDAIANRIVDKEMIPLFEKNRYYEGLNRATDILMGLAAGEFSSEQYRKDSSPGAAGYLVPVLALAIMIFTIKRQQYRQKTYQGRRSGSGGGGFLAMLLLGSMVGRQSGQWNNFSSGSGGFGGGSSFGGFGGGSFGGGGAGGSW